MNLKLPQNKQLRRLFHKLTSSRAITIGSVVSFAVIVALVGGSMRLFFSRASGAWSGIAVSPNHGAKWKVDTGGCVNGGSCVPHNGSIVGIASYGGNNTGYWLAGSDGGVFSFGGAPYRGSVPGLKISVSNIRGIASPPSGIGYWLLGTDGGVFSFNVGYHGNGRGKGTDYVAIASTYTGKGYWLLESNGTVRPFGDATGGTVNKGSGAVAIVGSSSGYGYWVLHSNGSIKTSGSVVAPPNLSGTYKAAARYGSNSSNCLAALDSGGVIHYTCPAVQVSMSTGSTSIPYGSSTSVKWSSANAYSCSGISSALKGSISTGTLTAAKTYAQRCNNLTKSSSASLTVKVGAKAGLTAISTNLPYNGQTTLNWSSANESSCSIDNGGPTGLSGSGGSWKTPKLTSPIRYNLTCFGISGALNAVASVGISVGGKPAPPPKTGGGGGGSSGGYTSTSTSGKAVDTSAPSAPANFQASYDDTSKSVKLNWSSASDNVGVSGYEIQRSEDNQKNWKTISGQLDGRQTTFIDLTPGFSKTYFYRIRAKDAAGNKSSFVIAQVTTGEFSSNSTSDQDTTVTSEDNVVSVLIPAGSLSDNAFCNLGISTDVLSPNNSGQIVVAGPYELSCRTSDGNIIDTFTKPFVLTANINAKEKHVKNLVYYGQGDDGNWNKLKILTHDKKASIDTVDLQTYRIFTVMGTLKKTPLIIKILIFLLIIGVIIVLIRFINSRLSKQRAQTEYDEYLRKAKGL